MPLRRWGNRVFADLNWQGPKMISRNRTPQTLPGYNGVYLISSRHSRYRYPHGQSSLAYVGSGRVEDRLQAHVSGNTDLIERLDAEGTMWFWYAGVPGGWHDCIEQGLFDDFVERHGTNPMLNKIRPPCRRAWSEFSLRHHGINFPYDFARSDFPEAG
jgi:hypothetical protein